MPTYYEILGVPSTATATEIRKAYLKLSLKYHPDKNPDNVQAAQAKFVEIGRAYEILSNEITRQEYDQLLRGGRSSGMGFNSGFASGGFDSTKTGSSTGGYSSSSTATSETTFDEKMYQNYRDFFDETVAGMSEADLAAAVGTAAMIGSLVGSIVGGHLASGATSHGTRGATSGASNLLTTAGSMLGSMVASEIAASSVRSLHQSSIQRMEYKQACRIAAERGEPLPQPPPTSQLDQLFGKTIKAVQEATKNPEETVKSLGDLWNKARAGIHGVSGLGADGRPNNSTSSRTSFHR